ncbi:MAG: zinc metalloprotease HtpX [Candidatus Aenigmatarchaeota archaeon]
MPLKLIFSMFLTIFLLFGFLFAILAAVSYYFGLSGYIPVIGAIILVIIQWYISPYIIKWTTNMRELKRSEAEWIYDIVENLCKKTKTPIPKIYIANIGAPNAFVFGRTPKSANLVITRGLLNTLTKEEVEAVIAHEIGHINHKDMVVMTIVSAIPIIFYFIARFLIFTPSRERNERKTGAAILIGFISFLIYFISNLLVLYLSRLREYYADRFSGKNTKPSLLARALAKITYGLSISTDRVENSAVRSFYIADPVSATKELAALSKAYEDFEISDKELKEAMEWEKKNPLIRFSEIFSTHPLTYKRIEALKKLEKEISEH